MDTQFEELVRLLEEEAGRQESKVAFCQAQYRAIRSNDLEYVEAKAADIETLNREGEAAEGARRRVAEALARRSGVPEEEVALETLAGVAPEPYRSRLRACDERIQAAQKEMRSLVLAGIACLQHAAGAIVQAMEAFKGCVQLVPDTQIILSGKAETVEEESMAA
jgi:hypothetical protein